MAYTLENEDGWELIRFQGNLDPSAPFHPSHCCWKAAAVSNWSSGGGGGMWRQRPTNTHTQNTTNSRNQKGSTDREKPTTTTTASPHPLHDVWRPGWINVFLFLNTTTPEKSVGSQIILRFYLSLALKLFTLFDGSCKKVEGGTCRTSSNFRKKIWKKKNLSDNLLHLLSPLLLARKTSSASCWSIRISVTPLLYAK